MELLGKEYLIEHCVEHYNATKRQESFDQYNSELLRLINNNLAHFAGGNTLQKSWKEMIEYKPETRSADEIKEHMLDRFKALED